MFYDAEKYKPPKPAVTGRPGLQLFINALTMRDPNETYDWKDARNCLCARYFGGGDWIVENRRLRQTEKVDLNVIARGPPDARGNLNPSLWTVGQALARARAA